MRGKSKTSQGGLILLGGKLWGRRGEDQEGGLDVTRVRGEIRSKGTNSECDKVRRLKENKGLETRGGREDAANKKIR